MILFLSSNLSASVALAKAILLSMAIGGIFTD